MRSRALGVIILAALALWALAAPAAMAEDRPPATSDSAQRRVIAAVPKNWPPQYSLDADGKPTGFAIDVMNEIAARANLEVTYRAFENFAEVEEALKAGRADIIPNGGITLERSAWSAFTAPVQTNVISIIVRAGTSGIDDLGDLAGHPVGIVEVSVGKKIIEPHNLTQAVVFQDTASALFGLLSGQVDAIIYARSVIEELARRAGVEDRIETVGKPLLEIKRAIRVRKDRPELLATLDKAVNDFVGTAEYQRIYAKWYGKPMPYWTGQRVAWAAGGASVALLIIIALWRYRLMVKMNRRIAASEEKFRDLIEGAVPGVLIHRDFRPLFVNRSYARLLGYDGPEEIMRQASVLEHAAPHERVRVAGYAAARMRGDEAPSAYEFQGVRKDGSLIWLENRARAVDWEGAPAVQRTVVDVTDKRQAEAELMLRSSQQAVVAELGQKALIEDDLDAYMSTTVTLVAKFLESDLCGVLELTPDGNEFLLRAGVGWQPGLVGKARISAGPELQAGFALSSKEPIVVADWRAETRFERSPMLNDHGVRCGVAVIIGDPEQPFGVLGVHRKDARAYSQDDVLFLKTVAVMLAAAVSRRRADGALRASEDRLRGALESLQEGFALYDADDRLVMINDVFRGINPNAQDLMNKGATFEDMIRANVESGMLADAVGREEEFIRKRLARHRNPRGSIIRRFSNGNWYIIKETRTPEGNIAITFADVTELKWAEEALGKSEALFRTIVDYSPTKIHIKDTDGRYTLINKEAEKLFGVTDSEGRGMTSYDLFPKQQADVFTAHDRAVIESRRAIEIEEKFNVDGVEHTYLTVKFPIFDGDRVVAVGAIGTDISKRKQEERKLVELQTELAHVSRVSTMGEMAAGLAHELNQPLTAITNYAKGTLRRLHTGGGDTVNLMPIMELIAEQALRAGEIIGKIRGFMNRSEPQKSRVDLHKAIDEVMSLLAGEVHMTGIEVGINLPRTLPAVMANSIQIQQVLLNLIRNAVAAMDNGDSNLHRLEIGAKANGADAVEIYVKDNGPGIPPDVEERLFEPFFTTKADGLGMGLSISRSIVDAHHGRIWVSSEKGVGASIHFTLPTGARVNHDAA